MTNFDAILKLTNDLIYRETGKPLNDVQRAVIEGTYQGQKYSDIAENYQCTAEYLKQDVGPTLWRLLSKGLGQRVRKNNFRTVIELFLTSTPPASDNDSSPENQNSRHNQGKFHQDWGESPDVSVFYGRESELTQLNQWMLAESCRIIAILGMGGMGKTALAVKFAQQIQGQFDYIIWRSLRNAPPLSDILQDLLKFLTNNADSSQSSSVTSQFSTLLDSLRTSRCLIILDNFESILQKNKAGYYRPTYENYGELLKLVGETQHHSSLLLTSREKPKEIVSLEGRLSKVYALPLIGLTPTDGREIFQAEGLLTAEAQWQPLITRYGGNPLALKIVVTTIKDLFSGNIEQFLAQIQQGTAVFGDIRDLLNQQLNHLSPLEQEVMYWLAINREPIDLNQLKDDLIATVSPMELLESFESLDRRCLITKVIPYPYQVTRYTQQPVVMEYMTDQFIKQVVQQIQQDNLALLNSHAFIKAQAKDYLRESQYRLILQPIIDKLTLLYPSPLYLEQKLAQLLQILRVQFSNLPGYGGGNLINLCYQLRLDLSTYDFSKLTIWQAYLQDANLQNVNFAEADLSKSVFAKTLGNSLVVALGQGGHLATGDGDGKILLWQGADGTQLLTCQEQTRGIRVLTFSPQGNILVSGGDDPVIYLWDVQTGQYLQQLQGHTDRVSCLSFSQDGRWLLSGSDDQTLRLWDVESGQCLFLLQGHGSKINTISWSRNQQVIVSYSDDQTLKFWEVKSGDCLRTLHGTSSWLSVMSGDNDSAIAISSEDDLLQLWDLTTGQCCQTLSGHQDIISKIALSNDQQLLGSSDDQTVKLWQLSTGNCLHTLQDFDSPIHSLAFSPDSSMLAIGSVEPMVQLWDINTGKKLRTLQSHRHQVWSFVLSPNHQFLATGSDDNLVRLWDTQTGRCLKILVDHLDWVWSLAFSSDNSLLATGSYDQTVKVWDVQTGKCLHTLRGKISLSKTGQNHPIQGITFNQDNSLLSTICNDHIQIWQVKTGQHLQTFPTPMGNIRCIAFHPTEPLLVSGGDDQSIKLWNIDQGNCIQSLSGHGDQIHTLAFSSDGQTLGSGSYDQTVRLWNLTTGKCLQQWPTDSQKVQEIFFNPQGQLLRISIDPQQIQLSNLSTGECLITLEESTHQIRSIQLSQDHRILISHYHDQTLKLWNLENGECWQNLRTDKPYDGMNIRGVTGITTAQKSMLCSLGAIELK